MSTIKFGIWGYGRIGVMHGRFYAMEQDKYEMVAVCDRDEEKLASAKAAYDCATYTDQTAFLADPNMELVVISTLSLDHTCHAIAALENGKSVLLDKPIAITDGELEILRQADKKYPGKLFVLHNLRFEPIFETIQSTIARGLLGEINLIKTRRHHRNWFFRSDWQTLLEFGGGLLNNWGNHEIDHAVQLLGSHATDIWSKLWHVSSGGDGDDHVKIILNGANNRVADIEISNSVTQPEPYCSVYGNRGTLVCNDSTNEVRIRYLDPEFKVPELSIQKDAAAYGGNDTLPWREETVKVEPDSNIWEYMDRKLAISLYQALREGKPFAIKNSDAFETVRIIQEVKKQNPHFNWIT